MNIKTSLSNVVYLLLFLMLCTVERDNPFDPKGDRYVPPQIVVQETLSTIVPDDTIHFDSGSVIVHGNRDESRFIVTVDNQVSSDWKPAGSFKISDLTDGRHQLRITGGFEPNSRTVTESFTFFVQVTGYKPAFSCTDDTAISSENGQQLTLNPVFAGADSLLTFEWMKRDSIISRTDSAILVFPSLSTTDAGDFFCRATNVYGSAISCTFAITVHEPAPKIRKKIFYYENESDGGHVPLDNNLYAPDEQIILAGNSRLLYKDGFTFAGWSFSPGDTVNVRATGSTITMGTEDIRVYAAWTSNPTFTVTYLPNEATGGDAPHDAANYGAGSSVTTPGNGTLIKTGWSFTGWNTRSDGTGTPFLKDSTFTISKHDTLYARWEIQNKFRFFLCFGQSNMSGGTGVSPSDTDKQIHPRVKVLAFANCGSPSRTTNQWADACEPMHCGDGMNSMGPSYAFGRTLADSLPNDTIGLIPCGQWGAAIEFFMKGGNYTGTKPPVPGGNNIYQWMLDKCIAAQTRGVFSGIIIHQGESNAGQPDWPGKVKGIIDSLKNDLGISDNIPVVVGELLYSGCYPNHNALVNEIPATIPNSYVASAQGLSGVDLYHFNLAGYRELGRRFAVEMLKGQRNR